MSLKKDFSFSAEQISAVLQDAVKKVKTEEDPYELTELKKIFKKNVPLTLRTYVAAYFAKQLSSNYHTGTYQRRDRYSRRSRFDEIPQNRMRDHTSETTVGTKPPVARAEIAEEYAATVFVSIGRNRHVYPRDLVALISQAGGVPRERIGEIRVLDNYSFIQLFAEDADGVISLLDGYEYRGRRLSVSYSRKKNETQPVETTNEIPQDSNYTDSERNETSHSEDIN